MKKEIKFGKVTIGFFAYLDCNVCKAYLAKNKIGRVKIYRNLHDPKTSLEDAVTWVEANFYDKGHGHPLCGHTEKGK